MSLAADLQANPAAWSRFQCFVPSVFNCGVECGDSEVRCTRLRRTRGARRERHGGLLSEPRGNDEGQSHGLQEEEELR